MRYTEKKYDREINDPFDLITFLVVTIFFAPYRLVGEIANKLMYLKKEAVEKLILVTVSLITLFIVWDGIRFIVFGKLDLVTGTIPTIVKFVVLVIVGLGSVYVLNKFNYVRDLENSVYEEDVEDVEDEEVDYSFEEEQEEEDVGYVEEELPSIPESVEGETPGEEEIDISLGLLEEEVKEEVVTVESSKDELIEFNFVTEISPEEILLNLEKNEHLLSGKTGRIAEPTSKDEVITLLLSDKEKEEIV